MATVSYTITNVDEAKNHVTATFESDGKTLTDTMGDIPVGDVETAKALLAERAEKWADGLEATPDVPDELTALVNKKQTVQRTSELAEVPKVKG